jgi:hypothetical protein
MGRGDLGEWTFVGMLFAEYLSPATIRCCGSMQIRSVNLDEKPHRSTRELCLRWLKGEENARYQINSDAQYPAVVEVEVLSLSMRQDRGDGIV